MLTNKDTKLKNVKTNDKEDYFKLIFSALKLEKYKSGFMSKREITDLVISDLFHEKYIELLTPCFNYDFGNTAPVLTDAEFTIYKVFDKELKKINGYFHVSPNSNGDKMFLTVSSVFCVPQFMISVDIDAILTTLKRDKDLDYILNPVEVG